MTITRDGKNYELTPDEMRKAFCEVDKGYMEEDAKDHCADFNEQNDRHIRFTKADYSAIANKYSEDRDCEVPENATYEEIVEDYVEDNFDDDDKRKEDK